MKSMILFILTFMASSAFSATEDNLKIVEIGGWANGNSLIYIRFDRPVGPDECRNTMIKVYLGDAADSAAALEAKQFIKSIALTAMTANLTVIANTTDECLHGNPSIQGMNIKI